MSGKININLSDNYIDYTLVSGLIDIDILGTGILSIFFSLIFCFGSILLIYKLSKYKIIEFHRSIIIFSFHSLLSLFMLYSLFFIVNDLDSYFQSGLIFPDKGFEQYYNFRHFGILTMAQIYRTLFYFFNLDFLSCGILFSCLGSFILIFYDKIIRLNLKSKNENKSYIYYIFFLVVFFPSLSIWTGYLGKEILTISILIFAATILIKIKNIFYVVLYFLPLVSLMSIIRPHFAFFFGVSFCFYFILETVKNRSLKYIIIILLLFLALSFGSLFTGNLSNFNPLSVFLEFFDSATAMRKNFSQSPGWIDTSSYNIIQLYFSFLYAPIFNLDSLRNTILSLENIFLVLITLLLLLNVDLKKLVKNNQSKFFLFFFISTSIVMSLYTADLGIYWRQKWLLLPYLFIGLSLIQKNNISNVKK